MGMTLTELAAKIGATVAGDGGHVVERCATLEDAGPADVTFLANKRYVRILNKTRAGAVVVAPDRRGRCGRLNLLVAEDPYFAFRQAMVELHGFRRLPPPGISPDARIDPTAEVGPECTIMPFVFVGPRTRIGRRCVIHPFCHVGQDAVLGDECLLFSNVSIYDRCVLGSRVTLHSGCVIGQDGFGYATHEGLHHKIPQSGNVVIEDDVEMGACCTVDRATLGSTRIGKGTKFSNMVTIGHGSTVGPHNLLSGQVGLAGSVKTGAYVAIGGQVGVANHLKIGDKAQVAAHSGVGFDVPPGAQVGGTPAVPLELAKEIGLIAVRLPQWEKEFHQMQEDIKALKAALNLQPPAVP